MPPVLAFVLGALSIEIVQLGLWLLIAPGFQLRKYAQLQGGHLVVLVGAGLLFCVAWKLQALDLLVAYLPEALTKKWGASGIPYTPQVGIIAGALFSFQGVDKVIAALKARRAAADTAPVVPSAPQQ